MDFMTGIFIASMNAGSLEQGFRRLSKKDNLKFDNKMKLDSNPFPQNMIGFSINMVNIVEPKEKGKVKVLTSEKAKQGGSVDPARKVTLEQIHKKESRFPSSQIEVGESSRPRVTSRIVLNKWQR
jgi:hypothetical protein